MDRFKLYGKALKTYGNEAQMRQAQEECAELIVAISHSIRGKCTSADMVSEIADVTIMCEQLAEIYGRASVNAVIEDKLKRLEERLK